MRDSSRASAPSGSPAAASGCSVTTIGPLGGRGHCEDCDFSVDSDKSFSG